MTSGLSFHKLIAQNVRERRWLPFLITVTGIFALVIGYYFTLGDAMTGGLDSGSGYYDRIAYIAESYLGIRSAFLVTLALIAAILAGYSGYLWLHSQEQVDFYNSTAARRGVLFSAIFTSGALQVLVPFVVCDLAAVILMPAARGVLSWRLVGIGLRGMAFAILVFCCLYSFVVLAVVLSARIMTTVVMTALLWLYGPLLYWLLEALQSVFFDTIVRAASDTRFLWLSPAFLAYGAAEERLGHVVPCLGLLCYGAAAFAGALAAYCLRPSEAAGNAFPFNRETTVIKCMIMVPSSLGIGMLLGTIAHQNVSGYYTTNPVTGVVYSYSPSVSIPWMAFGLLFGAFLIHTVLELLFQPDFRNIRRHWKSGCAGTAISLVVFAFMACDPMRVNLWLPDKTDVQAMSVNSNVADPWLSENSYYDYYDYETGESGAFFREYGAAYDLAQNCVESRASGRLTEASDAESRETSVVIGYLLKNGRKAYRRYPVSTARLCSMAEKLSESGEYRKNYYLTAALPSDFTDAAVSAWDPEDSADPVSLSLNADKRQALVDALAQDSTAQTLAQLEAQTPLCTLEIRGMTDGKETADWSKYYDYTLYIYPSYSNVLEQLAAQGVYPERTFRDSADSYPKMLDLYVYDGTDDKGLELTDPAAIQEMLSVLKRKTQIQTERSTETTASVQVTFPDGTYQSFELAPTSETTFRELFRKYKSQEAASPAGTGA